MKTLSNLPPGCTDNDIERQAGADDEPKLFTPGPWKRNLQQGRPEQIVAASTGRGTFKKGTNICIAVVQSWADEPPEDEAEANAHLIAAAPELKEALKYARRFLKSEDCDTAFIDAALAKAEGRA